MSNILLMGSELHKDGRSCTVPPQHSIPFRKSPRRGKEIFFPHRRVGNAMRYVWVALFIPNVNIFDEVVTDINYGQMSVLEGA